MVTVPPILEGYRTRLTDLLDPSFDILIVLKIAGKRRNSNMPPTNRFILTAILIIVITLAFAGGYVFGIYHDSNGGLSTSDAAQATSDKERLESIEQAWDIIFTDYVDKARLNSANMSRAAIVSMINTLNDPYTSYLDEEQYEIGKAALEGTYNGIGAYVTIRDNHLAIIAPIVDSPADKAGIKAGDIILQIDGEPVADLSLAEAIIKIRGPRDTVVRLLILHENDTEPVEIEIIRATLELPSIHFEMKEQIAHISIYDFTERTDDELTDIFKELDSESAEGIILDLRGNPGGLLETVINVASHFLTEGVIIEMRDNRGQVETFRVNKDMPDTDLPVVVLVDKASASGSEVLAGALQDHNRAVIAGSTTYGKGSVNKLYPLSDGSGIYLTTARWLTPNGRLIEGYGIEPDIKLDLTGEEAVEWAMEYLTGGGGGE
jgi:carboxyl-terminal processing protease